MEVNKHINFLKRRGFLIKESSTIPEDQLGVFPDGEYDSMRVDNTVEPKDTVNPKKEKTNPTKVQPSNTPEFELRDGEGKPLTDDLNFTTMCRKMGGAFCHLDKVLLQLIQDKDHILVKILKESITKIYRKLLPKKYKNLSKFNRLVGVVLRQSPDSAINTFKLISDHLETIKKGELTTLRNALGEMDTNDIDDDVVLELIDAIKYQSYSEYENSFTLGEHFKSFKKRLELSIKGEEILNRSLANQFVLAYERGVDYRVISKYLYKKILENFGKGIGKFIKADLQCTKTLYDGPPEDKNRTAIIKGPEDGKGGEYVEVKKMDYNLDSYLSEFFGIYKTPKSLPKELRNFKEKGDPYLMLYNQVIDDLYLKLKDNDGGILESVYNSFAGIMYDENRFIPRKYIKLYWSNRGQRLNDHRLSLRFRVVSDKVDGYIYDINSDTLKKESELNIKTHNKGEWKITSDIVTEASVNDKRGGEWDRDSSQGKMIRTKGGTKELDDDFDWAIRQAEATPDDPKIEALIQHFDSASEVIGNDFDDNYSGWYGNHITMNLQNGEEWVVGTYTSMGNALHEYWDNYIDNVGYEELGMDLADYVDVSDHWISQFCQDDAYDSVMDLSDEEMLDTYDYYDVYADIEELEEKGDELNVEIEELRVTLGGIQQTLDRMEAENQDYIQHGLSEPPHDEETMDNARSYTEEQISKLGHLENDLADIPYELDSLIDQLRKEVQEDSVDDCERCMQDPVDCMVNEKGWYSNSGEAIDAFGWDVDRESIIEYLSQDGYGSMSGYDGWAHEETVGGETYILIRVN
jgi:hypothetical protein